MSLQGGDMDIAHLHLMLNHVPVVGVVFGFFILLWGAIRSSKEIISIGLTTMILTALVAIPVYLTGEPAEEIVEHMPGVSESMIGIHEDAATLSLVLCILSGIGAIAALIFNRSLMPKVAGYSVIGALLLSLLTATSMVRTANLGGQIRHTEIRGGGQNNPSPGRSETDRDRKIQSDDDDD